MLTVLLRYSIKALQQTDPLAASAVFVPSLTTIHSFVLPPTVSFYAYCVCLLAINALLHWVSLDSMHSRFIITQPEQREKLLGPDIVRIDRLRALS